MVYGQRTEIDGKTILEIAGGDRKLAARVVGRLNAGWSLDDALNKPVMSQSACGSRASKKSPWRNQNIRDRGYW